jgi:hypothetical protein
VLYTDRHRSFSSSILRSKRAAIVRETFSASALENSWFMLCLPPQRTETHMARCRPHSQASLGLSSGEFFRLRVPKKVRSHSGYLDEEAARS